MNLFKVNRPRPASPHFIIASALKRQTLKLSRSETDAPFTSSEFKAPSLSAAVSRDRLSPSSFHCNSVLRHCESTCQEKSRRFFFFFFFLFFFFLLKKNPCRSNPCTKRLCIFSCRDENFACCKNSTCL